MVRHERDDRPGQRRQAGDHVARHVFALPLAIIGAFVALAVIGHATNIITGLAVSLQDAVLLVTVITAGMWIAYSISGGLYRVALAAAAMLSMAGIVVAAAILTPIGMLCERSL